MEENISQKKKQKRSRKMLRMELEQYEKYGVSLFLDGKRSTPKTIAKACHLADDGGYMRDYEENEEGRIVVIKFDYVSNASLRNT